MKKKFFLKADQIKDLATGYGGCFATDFITVEGLKVEYMYREEPSYKEDSGWRFFSGKETQEYVDDPNNTMIFDVNTIANYDPTIIKYLDMPIGTQLERIKGSEEFKTANFLDDIDIE